jgi:hypothetical protein
MAGKEYISFADRFDGGGPGQSGVNFEGGGIISDIGNALGGPSIFGNTFMRDGAAPGDRTRTAHTGKVPFWVDAQDGGGFGYSGDYFSGGPYSNLLNIAGIRPQAFDYPGAAAEEATPQLRVAPVNLAAPQPAASVSSLPGSIGSPYGPEPLPGDRDMSEWAEMDARFNPDYSFLNDLNPAGDLQLEAMHTPLPAAASATPTFTDFVKHPEIGQLEPRLQMQVYDLLFSQGGQGADPLGFSPEALNSRSSVVNNVVGQLPGY